MRARPSTYLHANDKPLGATMTGGAADFDFNYTPVSDSYPATSPTSYVVNTGDTLRSIAQIVFGDASLWYLIADANGISSDSQLKVGMNLTVPNKITNLHNSFETFKPYNAAQIIGDTTPTMPDPPPSADKGCGALGQFLMIVVMIVVAMWAPYALGMVVQGGTVTLGVAMTGAALGNFAGQFVGNLTGVQDGFDFGAVATAALTAGITHGVSSHFNLNGPGPGQLAAKAAIGSAVNQGVNILVGRQEKFDWRGVAAAAIAAPVAAQISGSVAQDLTPAGAKPEFGANLAGSFAGGVAAVAVRQVVYGGGKMSFSQVAADAFGNAVGQALTRSPQQAGEQQPAKLEAAYRDNDENYRLPGQYAQSDAAVEPTVPPRATAQAGHPDIDNHYALPGRYIASDGVPGQMMREQADARSIRELDIPARPALGTGLRVTPSQAAAWGPSFGAEFGSTSQLDRAQGLVEANALARAGGASAGALPAEQGFFAQYNARMAQNKDLALQFFVDRGAQASNEGMRFVYGAGYVVTEMGVVGSLGEAALGVAGAALGPAIGKAASAGIGWLSNLAGSVRYTAWAAADLFETAGRAAYAVGETLSARLGRYADDFGLAPAFGEGRLVANSGADWFEDVARNATRNPDSDKLVLGHFAREGNSYQKVAAHYNATYFKVDNWNSVTKGLSQDEVWKINETFLTQQLRQGKQVLFSHDPLGAKPGTFFAREVNFMQELGYSFRQKNQWTWEAVR